MSEINFAFQKTTTYNELVKKYDQNLITHLKHK